MSTTDWPNSDAVSEESTASGRRSQASTVNSVNVGASSEGTSNKGGKSRSGGAADETDSAEAGMEKILGRFLERGPPSNPTRGVQYPIPTPSSTTQHATPKISTTENGRVVAQKDNVNTTPKRQKS